MSEHDAGSLLPTLIKMTRELRLCQVKIIPLLLLAGACSNDGLAYHLKKISLEEIRIYHEEIENVQEHLFLLMSGEVCAGGY